MNEIEKATDRRVNDHHDARARIGADVTLRDRLLKSVDTLMVQVRSLDAEIATELAALEAQLAAMSLTDVPPRPRKEVSAEDKSPGGSNP